MRPSTAFDLIFVSLGLVAAALCWFGVVCHLVAMYIACLLFAMKKALEYLPQRCQGVIAMVAGFLLMTGIRYIEDHSQ